MRINEIENSVENYEKYMTIYYNKKSGKIVGCPTGINDMTPYKLHDPQLLEIWDYTILPVDYNVINNRENFVVQDGKIKIEQSVVNNYEIAR